MGLEVSRLARNSADWHRLTELCSLAGALILDEDGIASLAFRAPPSTKPRLHSSKFPAERCHF